MQNNVTILTELLFVLEDIISFTKYVFNVNMQGLLYGCLKWLLNKYINYVSVLIPNNHE